MRLAFDAAESNGKLAAFNAKEVKKAAAEEKERIPLQKDIENQRKDKVVNTSFPKIVGRGPIHWGRTVEKGGQLAELRGDQNQVL